MNTFTKTAMTALVALTAMGGAAQALDLKVGTGKKLVPTQAQLGIIAPNSCPGNAKMTAWVKTNTTGKVNFFIVRKQGTVYGPYTANAVQGSGGVYLATMTQNIAISTDINAQYRVVVPGTNVASNWVPLNVDC